MRFDVLARSEKPLFLSVPQSDPDRTPQLDARHFEDAHRFHPDGRSRCVAFVEEKFVPLRAEIRIEIATAGPASAAGLWLPGQVDELRVGIAMARGLEMRRHVACRGRQHELAAQLAAELVEIGLGLDD